jgi:diamine N-acetyltransferase
MQGIEIQSVREDQLELLRVFAERTFRDAWQSHSDPADFELYCAEAFSPETVAAEFQNPHARFYFVWQNDDAPVAYFKLNFDRTPPGREGEKTVQIHRIYVLKGHQSGGIGEKMLHFITVEAKKAGASRLWLGVWKKAERSIHFYEKNGFTISGTEVFRLGRDAQEDWLMEKGV